MHPLPNSQSSKVKRLVEEIRRSEEWRGLV